MELNLARPQREKELRAEEEVVQSEKVQSG